MSDTVLKNAVTRDVVTLKSPHPTRKRNALVFTTEIPAGAAGSPLHRHSHLTGTLEVLEGCVTFQVGKTERVLAAGASMSVRSKTLHGFCDASNSPAVLRRTATPGVGFEQFLRGMQASAEAGRANAAGMPRDPRRLPRLLLDTNLHFSGLPMGLQRVLFSAFAALAPDTTH
ncbi:cupin domain-containing protein [Fertoebacter nigrum]|uniref:Cupin domain-containing protein n=1 Tax=Fertoeibacter niger TaxID=2656921 RepID=A0A8X8H8Q6_9RHOB|nr:cupin domain-containing protein [Fertoeibacter niger]NUB45631.1 cupin domain-containing protein [Fertoeibacter niger]